MAEVTLVPLSDLQVEIATHADLDAIKKLWRAQAVSKGETVIDVSSDDDVRAWIDEEVLFVAKVPDTDVVVGTIRVHASSEPETVNWILGQYELTGHPLKVGTYHGEKDVPEGRLGQQSETVIARDGDYGIYVGTVFTHPLYRDGGLSRHLLQSAVMGKLADIVQYFEEGSIKRIVLVFSTDRNEGGRRIQRRNFSSSWLFLSVIAGAVSKWEGRQVTHLNWQLHSYFYKPMRIWEDVSVLSFDESCLTGAVVAQEEQENVLGRVGWTSKKFVCVGTKVKSSQALLRHHNCLGKDLAPHTGYHTCVLQVPRKRPVPTSPPRVRYQRCFGSEEVNPLGGNSSDEIHPPTKTRGTGTSPVLPLAQLLQLVNIPFENLPIHDIIVDVVQTWKQFRHRLGKCRHDMVKTYRRSRSGVWTNPPLSGVSVFG
ncbi:hypothetical protein M427DRAFT_46826 [Gonapodya prolifera JEL478]|uniref:Uncharacterized protein n=1 Tax=Gonapodya prolifera (strain JEL478) TaxID=1344416 RepID=A0A139A5A5_GONPJ|nr:hypothetical protein M427DRAFT_46826 [Gonapodya prolifera JEL478]|eukprot:KXS11809.1 hypothetical protein M427DRAFT_46826 [Gonapodya prolifera JEL478]